MSHKRLSILHFNDAYEIERAPCFVRQWNETGDSDTLRLFSGDILNPSFLSTIMHGKQFIPFFKSIKLDACAVGNHELDWGLQTFKEITQDSGAPWLIYNYKHRDSGDNFLGLSGTFIREAGGYKVGVVGIVDASWEATTILDNSLYTLVDPVEAAKKAVADFKTQNCDFVIALTHADTSTDERLADEVPGLDIVLGGHNHVYIAEKRGEKLLVKSGCDFKFYTEIEIQERTKTESWEDEDGGYTPGGQKRPLSPSKHIEEPICLLLDDMNQDEREVHWALTKEFRGKETLFSVSIFRHKTNFHGPFDELLQNEVDKMVKSASVYNEEPVAFLHGEFNIKSNFIRSNESKIGDLAADLARICMNVDIGLVQSGHIRSEHIYGPNSAFRYIDLVKTFPLCDVLIAMEGTSAQIQTVLEDGLQFYPNPRGCFPNVSGMTAQFKPANPPNARILREKTLFSGETPNPELKYTITAIEVLVKGGDNYVHFPELKKLPVVKEVTCFMIFKRFFDLASSAENREEFALIRPLIGKYSLDQLMSWKKSGSPEGKTISKVTDQDISADMPEQELIALFRKLTQEAAERVLMYRLARDIVVLGEKHVFGLDGDLEGRLQKVV